MVREFFRPTDSKEALALLAGPGRLPLAGGTVLLSPESKRLEFEAVSLGAILPRGVSLRDGSCDIGAATTFQELVDSALTPAVIAEAARGMIDRNVRNRATVGGNLGADESCPSLLPILLALDAKVELLDGRAMSLEDWLELAPGPGRRGLIKSIRVEAKKKSLAGIARWSRTSGGHPALGAAVVFTIDKSIISTVRIVLGGVATHARRLPELESGLAGRPFPSRDTIEALALGHDAKGRPHLSPEDDSDGSAAYKRSRIAMLLADAMIGAAPFGQPEQAPPKAKEART